MPDLTALSRRSFILTSLALAACKSDTKTVEVSGVTMGTTYQVVALQGTRTVDRSVVKAAIDQALAQVNQQMSNWDQTSEISRFNALSSTESVPMSPGLAKVMQAADQVNRDSAGRFDTTVGPLIELWGFGAQGTQNVPTQAQITAAQQRSGHENALSVGQNALRKHHPEARVYLSAIGKGFGADQIGQALQSLGMDNYLVEIGGDLYASGVNPQGQPWQIGIEKPAALSGGVMDVIGVSGLGLASSGDYRNYFERDGVRFSHVIDPATGRPITHKTASTTVLAENAMLADAWATAMLILGRERGLEIAREKNLAVLFVERDETAQDLRFKTSASDRFTALTA